MFEEFYITKWFRNITEYESKNSELTANGRRDFTGRKYRNILSMSLWSKFSKFSC